MSTTRVDGQAKTYPGTGVALRVRRLIGDHDVVDARPAKRAHPAYMVWCAALVAAGWVGTLYGDTIIGLLPGVGR